VPRILITTDGADGREAAVLLQERVVPSDLESDHLSARLVERVGWALVDADEIEHSTPAPARPELQAKRERKEKRPLRAA
jgi:hypothetical protein